MPPVPQAAFAPELALPPPYQAVRLREFGAAQLAPANDIGAAAGALHTRAAESDGVLAGADQDLARPLGHLAIRCRLFLIMAQSPPTFETARQTVGCEAFMGHAVIGKKIRN